MTSRGVMNSRVPCSTQLKKTPITSKVSAETVETVSNITILHNWIIEAIGNVTGDLWVTWQKVDRRLDVLRATKGAHIDIL